MFNRILLTRQPTELAAAVVVEGALAHQLPALAALAMVETEVSETLPLEAAHPQTAGAGLAAVILLPLALAAVVECLFLEYLPQLL